MMVVSSVCMCFPYYKVIYILIGNLRPAKPESKVTKTNFISFAQSWSKTFANLFCMCVVTSLPNLFWPYGYINTHTKAYFVKDYVHSLSIHERVIDIMRQ